MRGIGTSGTDSLELPPAPTVGGLAAAYERGTLTPEQALGHCLARIDALDGAHNSFVMVDRAGAASAARASGGRWRRGAPLGPLDGVPISVKDMLPVAGLPSRCGSLTTSDAPSPVSAPVVERLLAAGAVVVGLTATAEFGGAPVTISPLTGITRNAWDASRTAGGSSGGAAVGVALGLCAGALASDTGGSIRVPAAFNGVVGMKPTGGRIPTDPASAVHTLGCPGPIAANVADCARLFQAMTRRASRDDPELPEVIPAPADLRHLKIVVSRTLGHAAWISPQVTAAFEAVLAALRAHGCALTEIEPGLADPLPIFQTLTRANYAAILGHLDEAQAAQLSPQVRDARAAGLTLTAAQLLAAQSERREYGLALRAALPGDLLLTPMTAVLPFEAERFMPDTPELRASPRAWSPYGYPFNLSGQPALTLPCGIAADGLPVGLQLVAAPWQEALLLTAARQIEALLPPMPIVAGPHLSS